LTGQRLFAAETPAEILAKVFTYEVPAPSSLAPDVPPALDKVLMLGLARDRTARFETARAAALALEATGPLATPSEVGEWVERTAQAALNDRARSIAEIESVRDLVGAQSSSHPPPRPSSAEADPTVLQPMSEHSSDRPKSGPALRSTATPSAAFARHEHEPRRSRRLMVALVTSALLAVGAVSWLAPFSGARPTAPVGRSAPAEPAAQRATEEPGAAASAADVAREEPAPSAESVSTATSAAVPPTSVATLPRPQPGSRGATTRVKPREASSKSNCSPPYTLDAAGHRRYKLECL
jgi:serine/threonine-protein kinase